jgi:hypothetical protein
VTGGRAATRALAALATAVALTAVPGVAVPGTGGPAATAAAVQQVAPSLEVTLTGISTVVGGKVPLDYRVSVRNRGQGPVGDLQVTAKLGRWTPARS